jgi:type IV secretion system protein VirB8
MFRKKAVTPNIQDSVSKSLNFEVTIADIAKRSERRAWFVAWFAILMSLILAGGYYYMLPLKEKVPYLVMADAYTGTSTVARLRDNFADNTITTAEAINKSNVAHFVMARESYDYNSIGERDWLTVFTMANSEVGAGYKAVHSPVNNPDQPYKLYGKQSAIRIKILVNDILPGSKIDGAPKTATVRFQRSLYDKNTGTSRPMDSRQATVQFVYKNNLDMNDEQRVINPLGFQATAYRVVTDYSTAPPIQGEAAPVFFGPPAAVPQPAQPAPQTLDAQGNPMQPAGAPPAVPPAPTDGMQPPADIPPQTPNPTNNTNGAATR